MKTIVTSRNGLQPRKRIKRGGNQNGNDGNRKCKVRKLEVQFIPPPPPSPLHMWTLEGHLWTLEGYWLLVLINSEELFLVLFFSYQEEGIHASYDDWQLQAKVPDWEAIVWRSQAKDVDREGRLQTELWLAYEMHVCMYVFAEQTQPPCTAKGPSALWFPLEATIAPSKTLYQEMMTSLAYI